MKKGTSEMAAEKRMLRAEDIAAALDCSIVYAYKLMQRNIIPSVRFGGSVRAPRAAFEAWLKQQNERALARAGMEPPDAAA